jgi:hypothetical protein
MTGSLCSLPTFASSGLYQFPFKLRKTSQNRQHETARWGGRIGPRIGQSCGRSLLAPLATSRWTLRTVGRFEQLDLRLEGLALCGDTRISNIHSTILTLIYGTLKLLFSLIISPVSKLEN